MITEIDPAVAADVLDWYRGKLNEIKGLIKPTLMVVALFFVIVSYVMFRSWKKAVIAGIGGAIVVAIVANLDGLSRMVQDELKGSLPATSQVVRGDGRHLPA